MDSSIQQPESGPSTLSEDEKRTLTGEPLAILKGLLKGSQLSARPLPEMWRYTRADQLPLEKLNANNAALPWGISVGDSAGSTRLPRGVAVVRGEGASASLFQSIPRFDWKRELGCSTIADPVASRHFGFLSSSTNVVIEKDAIVREPVVISPLPSGPGDSYSPYLLITAQSGSSATIFIEEHTPQEVEFFAPWYEFVLAPNSSLTVVVLQRLGGGSKHLGRHRFHLLRDAKLNLFEATVGGRVARTDLDCTLHEDGAVAEMRAVSVAAGVQHLDLHPTQHHKAPNCTSRLFAKAVVADRARSVYFGMIDVAPKAQRTDAYQKSANLLLSPTARADAIPNLTIGANDVKCSHGASVGQVDEEELFYAMSRGLPRDKAERLIVDGFFNEIVLEIRDETIRSMVLDSVEGAMRTVGRAQ